MTDDQHNTMSDVEGWWPCSLATHRSPLNISLIMAIHLANEQVPKHLSVHTVQKNSPPYSYLNLA